jgi:hypothetical protein
VFVLFVVVIIICDFLLRAGEAARMRMLFRSEKRNSLLKNQLEETTFGVSGMEQMILMRE